MEAASSSGVQRPSLTRLWPTAMGSKRPTWPPWTKKKAAVDLARLLRAEAGDDDGHVAGVLGDVEHAAGACLVEAAFAGAVDGAGDHAGEGRGGVDGVDGDAERGEVAGGHAGEAVDAALAGPAGPDQPGTGDDVENTSVALLLQVEAGVARAVEGAVGSALRLG